MKKLFLSAILFAALLLSGCVGMIRPVTATGDNVNIILQKNASYTGELLGFNDDGILIMPDSTTNLVLIAEANVKSITVNGYSNSQWPIPVIALQVLPPIALLISVSRQFDEISPAAFILFLPAVVTALLFADSDQPDPVWDCSTSTESLRSMRKYARFADGINQERLDWLLKRYRQDSLKRVE